MPDITRGLPTLSPEDIQAQQDRARLIAAGNAPGAGATSSAVSPNTAAISVALPPAALPALAAPAPETGAQDTARSLPKNAPAAVSPVVDSGATPATNPSTFTLNGVEVPFGRLGSAGGSAGNAGVYENLPGGGKQIAGKFVDPRDALEVGYRLQSAYRDQSIQSILDAAGDGGQLGYRARVAALAQAFGPNNFGSVSVGGANALNSAIAGITSAGIGAGATLGASENSLRGHLASVDEAHYEHATSSVPTGTVVGVDKGTKLGIPLTTYGQRPAQVGGLPTPYNQNETPPVAPPRDGEIRVDRNGNRGRYNAATRNYDPVK